MGIAIFDRLERELQADAALKEMMWRRREIENYFCTEEVLIAYAVHNFSEDLFGLAEREPRKQAMREAISEVTAALGTLNKPSPWSPDIKATDDFLDPLFKRFFKKLRVAAGIEKIGLPHSRGPGARESNRFGDC